jgi:hypothetical protein
MSVVTEEMVEAAFRAARQGHDALAPGWMQRALDAVAPLIAKAERERCAGVAETHEWFVGGIGTKALGSGEAKAIAAAIRALKETT